MGLSTRQLENLLDRVNGVLFGRFQCEARYQPFSSLREAGYEAEASLKRRFQKQTDVYLPIPHLEDSADNFIVLKNGASLEPETLEEAISLLDCFIVKILSQSEQNEALEAIERAIAATEQPSNVVYLRRPAEPQSVIWNPLRERKSRNPILLRGDHKRALEQVAYEIHDQLRNVALVPIEDLAADFADSDESFHALDCVTILIRNPTLTSVETLRKIQQRSQEGAAGPQLIALWHSDIAPDSDWAHLYDLFCETIPCPSQITSTTWLSDWIESILFK